MQHVRGASYHPQTQYRNERWHQTLRNRIRPESCYVPGDLKSCIVRRTWVSGFCSGRSSSGERTPAPPAAHKAAKDTYRIEHT
jgi:hypothetical protein